MQTRERFWSDRSVLVTGHTGFLGCWLSRALCERGARLVGLAREAPPEVGSLFALFGLAERIAHVDGTLANYGALSRLVSDYEVETVFHLAAQSQVSNAREKPRSTFEANIQGTWNLLESVRNTGRPIHVILASSEAIYGDSSEVPFLEETPSRALNPYGASKLCAELLGQTYHHTYGLEVSMGRCSNLYGGGDLNYARIVPGTIQSVLHEKSPRIRGDGHTERDYLYVEDAVDAYLALAETMDGPGIAGEVFNFGSEHPVSVSEVVETILKIMNRRDLTAEILDEEPVSVPVKYLSAAKARRRLAWTARTSLEDGLTRSVRWYRDAGRELWPAAESRL